MFCQFGLTSFALEAKGGEVTGLDFSKTSIEKANELKHKFNSKCRFIESNIFSYNSEEKYDVVYASFGILHWVKDISLLIDTVHRLLNKDGKFILIDIHSDLTFHILKELGAVELNNNHFQFYSNIKEISELQKSPIGGNYKKEVVQVPSDLYLHTTDAFVEDAERKFLVEKLDLYNYLPYRRRKDDIKVGNRMYRNINLQEGKHMCFSTVLKAK